MNTAWNRTASCWQTFWIAFKIWRTRDISSRQPRRRSCFWSSVWRIVIGTAFDALGFHVSVSGTLGDQAATSTEATIKLKVDGVLEHTVSEGDGPVNALDGALRKALERHYPRLKEMSLVDYKVRVINARAGTAARVRVVIESKDQDSVWGTVGVSENVIEASWLALVDSFEYKLAKDARAVPSARLVLAQVAVMIFGMVERDSKLEMADCTEFARCSRRKCHDADRKRRCKQIWLGSWPPSSLSTFVTWRTRVERAARSVTEEQLWARPFPFGNSIGHLVLHLTGNLNHYIGSLVAGSGYVRDRAHEFTDPTRYPGR